MGIPERLERFRAASVVVLALLISMLSIRGLPAQDNTVGENLAPYVPTPYAIVEKMLELAGVGENDIVYDLGCGDGRIVIMAAEKFGARGVGVDYNPERVKEAKAIVKEKGLEDKVEIILQDALKVDLSPATVVTLYLLARSNALLKPNLENQLKPGSRVVSHAFDMEGWKAKKSLTVSSEEEYAYDHVLYLWVMGEHKE